MIIIIIIAQFILVAYETRKEEEKTDVDHKMLSLNRQMPTTTTMMVFNES